MAIDVTVTEQCDRCKRKEQVVISSDKVAEFEAKAAEAAARRGTVDQFVRDNQDKLPDLVVIFKGKVTMLSNVCDAYCAKTVINGLDVLFREYKERKPREKKTPEEKAAAKAAKEQKAAAATAAKNAPKDALKDDKKPKGGKAA
jgi:hypothetical protein